MFRFFFLNIMSFYDIGEINVVDFPKSINSTMYSMVSKCLNCRNIVRISVTYIWNLEKMHSIKNIIGIIL